MTQNLAALSILNSIRKYPKICLVTVPISVQKIEPLSSSEQKWQAIENLVHILLEWTLTMDTFYRSLLCSTIQPGRIYMGRGNLIVRNLNI